MNYLVFSGIISIFITWQKLASSLGVLFSWILQKKHCFASISLAPCSLVPQTTQERLAGTWSAVRTLAPFCPHTKGADLPGTAGGLFKCVCVGGKVQVNKEALYILSEYYQRHWEHYSFFFWWQHPQMFFCSYRFKLHLVDVLAQVKQTCLSVDE